MMDQVFYQSLTDYEEMVRIIVKSGILTLRSGSITFHIDATGNIRKIDTNQSVMVKQ